MNADAMLARVKAGEHLSEEELKAVRAALSNHAPDMDRYTMLHILGKANDRRSRQLVESHLAYGISDPSDDGMIRRIALQILGRMWSLPEAFAPAASMALSDPSSYVRAAAATVIGHLGRAHESLRSKAAEVLITGFDRGRGDEPEVWESFYEGILELFDVPPGQRPSPFRELRQEDVRAELLERTRHLAETADGH